MSYASAADVITLYGEDALSILADRDGDAIADAPVIEAALARACAEIDVYIGARYPLPLAQTPVMLTQLAANIAVYQMAVEGGAGMELHRQRYEDALKLLQRLADGKAALPLPAGEADEPGAAGQSPQPVIKAGPPRLFTREHMRGL